MSIQLHTGTVKYAAGKIVNTTYGEKINVVIETASGEEIKLWGKPNDPSLTALNKGQEVQLLKDQKGYKLVATDTSAAEPEAEPQTETTSGNNGSGKRPPPKHWTNDEKRTLALKADEHAKLLKYCQDQILVQFGEGMSEESLRTLCITLYLQVVKN